jgi:hypothetical protein
MSSAKREALKRLSIIVLPVHVRIGFAFLIIVVQNILSQGSPGIAAKQAQLKAPSILFVVFG